MKQQAQEAAAAATYDNMITPRNMERVEETDEDLLQGADESGVAGDNGDSKLV